MWATLWMSWFLLSWRLARARYIGVAEFGVLSFHLSAIAVLVVFRPADNVRVARWLGIAAAVATWQVVAIPLIRLYTATVGRLVFDTIFGETLEKQSLIATTELVLIGTITPFAGLASLVMLDRFLPGSWNWRAVIVTLFAWTVLSTAAWGASLHFELYQWLQAQRWQFPAPALFYPPDFVPLVDNSPIVWVPMSRNPVLAEALRWTAATVPVSCVVLWFFTRQKHVPRTAGLRAADPAPASE